MMTHEPTHHNILRKTTMTAEELLVDMHDKQQTHRTRCKDRVTRVKFLGLSNCYVRPLLSLRAGLSPAFHTGRQVSFPHKARDVL